MGGSVVEPAHAEMNKATSAATGAVVFIPRLPLWWCAEPARSQWETGAYECRTETLLCNGFPSSLVTRKFRNAHTTEPRRQPPPTPCVAMGARVNIR